MRCFAFGLAFALAAAVSAQEFKVGSQVQDFTIKTVTGEPVQFDSLKGPVTVVTFIATKCPVSNAYNERMAALYNEYSAKGVKFVFINANRTEPAAEVAEHAKNHFPFAVYKDDNNVVADRFGASVTPEAYVITKDGTIVYHGSIDDSQELRRVKQQRLHDALAAVLAGKPVAVTETKAFGCTIKRAGKTS